MRDAASIRVVESLTDVAAADWNALDLGGNPTARHEFLLALEETGCANDATGWHPRHLLLTSAQGQLIGAVPLYLKSHSWGEFVFDWSWAGAYARFGLDYYPKLVSTIPFTPASGIRLLTRIGSSSEQRVIRNSLIDALLELTQNLDLSSAHVLFATADEQALLAERGFITRSDCQFHWHNNSFATFDDFIATFRADKRKKALRERRRVAEQGIHFTTLRGHEMTAEQWRIAMRLSEATFRNHGHEHYLNVDFFQAIAKALPGAVMVKFAMLRDAPVATAIFYQSHDTLYGRYWGAVAELHSLHFETCYYQGIDYCIEQGLAHFEPGTQGEHKIARGFRPAKTGSAHWIADPQLGRAIRAHAEQEHAAIERYIAEINEQLPFHREQTV